MDSTQEKVTSESTDTEDKSTILVDEGGESQLPIDSPKRHRVSRKALVGVAGGVVVVLVIGVFAFQAGEEISVQISEEIVEKKLEEGVTEIVYWQRDARYFYEIELLRIVLENTVDEYGPYILKPSEVDMTGDRAIGLLEAGEIIDVSFHSVNPEREERLLPIKVPLLRGLLGYRVFLIRNILAVFSRTNTFLLSIFARSISSP